ncbi:glucan endo-1,3-beta-glucosidase 4-like protein, partial [Trifolium pratense]
GYGSCRFTGSSGAGGVSLPPMALGPSSGPFGASMNLQVSPLQYLISAVGVFFALMIL